MRLRLWMALTACIMPVVSGAETTANFGFVNDYIFRGVYQEDSSASAGLDFASNNGFYVGTWGADVGDGLETDLYFGYGGEAGSMSWGVGYTGYFYTDDFDDTYQEVNMSLGVGLFSLDIAVGEWDGFGTSQDYTFTSLTFQPEKGPYILLGGFSGDFDGEYIELGYTFDFEGIDLNVSALYSNDVDKPGSSILLSQDSPLAETALVFGISKTISLGGAGGAGSVND